MEKEKRIRLQYCPHCAKALRIAPDARKVICPCCAVPVHPVSICPTIPNTESDFAGTFSDIRAAYSYVRVLLESYDWNTRTLHHSVHFSQTESIVNRYRRIAAEDACTWQMAFDSTYIPVAKKLQGFSAVLDRIASLYAEHKSEAVTLFDSLQQVTAFVQKKQDGILQQLALYTKNAQLCNADTAIIADMQKKVQTLQTALQELQIPKSAEDIDTVRSALDENNRRLSEQFAEIGIDLELEYRRIGNHLTQKQFKDAVAALARFNGYKNTNTLLKDVNRCYRFDEVLQVTGKLLLDKGGNLFAAENGRPSAEPCVRGIAQILGTYADRLFYTDTKMKLCCYDLTEKTSAEFDRKRTFPECVPVASDDPCSLYFTYRTKDGKGPKVLAKIDPVTFRETVICEDAAVIHGIRNNILVYADSKSATFAVLLADNIRYDICVNRIELCEIKENYIVYTRNAPTTDNKNLYLYRFSADEKEQTLATNIRSQCCIAGRSVYYTVGNKLCSALYAADMETRHCAQIAQTAFKVEHTDCDAVYYSIGDIYNRTLLRFDTQNETHTQLTDSLHRVIGSHCGKLLYLDAESNLCSVLSDGTDKKNLFADVREVLMMHGGKLFFTAADDMQTVRDETGNTYRSDLLSLYSISHDGNDLHKLAHGIAAAQCFNSKEIDFFKNVPTADGSTVKWLFRYNTRTDETFKLMDYSIGNKKGK